MIENVPTADIPKLKSDPRVALSSVVSSRLIYLHLDSGREKDSPFVTTADGQPMEANPLRDVRVRKAISKMIDREAIDSRIMEGQAVPAGQLIADQFFGTSKKLKADKYDPEGRRSCSPRPAIRTASASRCTRPTTATSTTRRSPRRWRST